MEKFSIVTGASTGIGFEMAKSLAGLSHNLLLVSRSAIAKVLMRASHATGGSRPQLTGH